MEIVSAKEIILTLLFIFIIVYQAVINYLNRKDHLSRENDLLNRIQSNTFPEYVDGTNRLRRKPDEPLTSKERQAGIEAATKVDRDILEMG